MSLGPTMSETSEAEQIAHNIIAQGRAMVQFVKAIDVLLDRVMPWHKRLLLKYVRVVYRHQLDGLLGDVPEGIVAAIRTGAAVRWGRGGG